MRNYVAAVTHLQLESLSGVTCVIGDPQVALAQVAWRPFDERIVHFLGELSRAILIKPDIRNYPDLVSLAYWCRPAAIKRLAVRYESDEFLVGRGVVFHIPPSNVPLNFAYSLFCGLLAGNSNIVRMSSTESNEVDELIRVFHAMAREESVGETLQRICLIRYGHDDIVTKTFSVNTNARVIWGGNEAVRRIRATETAPRSVDVSFADRVSMSLLNADRVVGATTREIVDLVDRFIADGYTFDQNACSSPRLVMWLGTSESVATAGKRFWTELESRVREKESLPPAIHMRRFVELCEMLANSDGESHLVNVLGGAARIELAEGEDWRKYSTMRFGTFTEVSISVLDDIKNYVSADVQTLGYFGFYPSEIRAAIEGMDTAGIDRVVPIGQALIFDTIWDGYDLIRSLARTIVII